MAQMITYLAEEANEADDLHDAQRVRRNRWAAASASASGTALLVALVLGGPASLLHGLPPLLCVAALLVVLHRRAGRTSARWDHNVLLFAVYAGACAVAADPLVGVVLLAVGLHAASRASLAAAAARDAANRSMHLQDSALTIADERASMDTL